MDFPQFADHIDRFNFHRLDIVDPHDDCYFYQLNPIGDYLRIRDEIVYAFPEFDCDFDGLGTGLDQIIILFYCPDTSECRYARALSQGVIFMPSWHPGVVIHEFGHSFGGLGDEYNSVYEATVDPWFPNIASMTPGYTCDDKWGHLMHLPGVGCFQNAGATNWYRPTYSDCVMRYISRDHHCPVCSEVVQSHLDRFEGVAEEKRSMGDIKRMFR